ncbi:Exostosin-2 [Trichinella pseudospiralis]|uniref:Exostosin-2 n=1 Tax=Trichinella pseudospiralis TaxID=6337 RepID=A0A0V1J4D2_TRIPS|nr:Exostosin-2 [Trichinella pseudospiralis]KRZ26143.1 Exostosin-2 [Trichinella pseudospiralis]KRZ29833.1 Exostosin-2 [Trichinella pseudospiralis]
MLPFIHLICGRSFRFDLSFAACASVAAFLGWFLGGYFLELDFVKNESLVLNRTISTSYTGKHRASKKYEQIRAFHNCNSWSCFNPYRCASYGSKTLAFYAIWDDEYFSLNTTTLSALRKLLYNHTYLKKYFITKHSEACLSVFFVQPDLHNSSLLSELFSKIPSWYEGENSLIFDLIVDRYPMNDRLFANMKTGKAMIASCRLQKFLYRKDFDLKLPPRLWLIAIAQPLTSRRMQRDIRLLANHSPLDILVLSTCSLLHIRKHCSLRGHLVSYPEILQQVHFCLIFGDSLLAMIELSYSLMTGCIPIIVGNNCVLPFEELIDWSRCSLRIANEHLHLVIKKLKENYPPERIEILRNNGQWIWKNHFASFETIMLSVFSALERRLFSLPPFLWTAGNLILGKSSRLLDNRPLLFLNRKTVSNGFTGLILSRGQQVQLLNILTVLAQVSFCKHVIVSCSGDLPTFSKEWYTLLNSLKVTFFFNEESHFRIPNAKKIHEEAVLLIDECDSITASGIEAAFNVWQQSPSQLVILEEYSGSKVSINYGAIFHKFYIYVANKLKSATGNVCEKTIFEILIAQATKFPILKVDVGQFRNHPVDKCFSNGRQAFCSTLMLQYVNHINKSDFYVYAVKNK